MAEGKAAAARSRHADIATETYKIRQLNENDYTFLR